MMSFHDSNPSSSSTFCSTTGGMQSTLYRRVYYTNNGDQEKQTNISSLVKAMEIGVHKAYRITLSASKCNYHSTFLKKVEYELSQTSL